MGEHFSRLERENRHLKRAGVAALAVLGLVVALAVGSCGTAKVTDEVRSRRFVLVGTDGKDRAQLGQETDGTVRLAMTDHNGKLRTQLRVTPEGSPSLTLYGTDEKVRILIAVKDRDPLFGLEEEDGTHLSLYGFGLGIQEGEKFRAVLKLDPRGSPSLKLLDKEEKVIWSAP